MNPTNENYQYFAFETNQLCEVLVKTFVTGSSGIREDNLISAVAERLKQQDESIERLTFIVDLLSAALIKEHTQSHYRLRRTRDVIHILPSKSADSRSAEGEVTREDLFESSLQHIGDVKQALKWFAINSRIAVSVTTSQS